ncbi:MAG: hypothetical protein WD096_03930 [Actinomycetota bacterium]
MGNQPRGGRGANKPQPDRPTKTERKDEARAEREQIHARMARRRRSRVGALIVGIAAAAIVIVLVISLSGETGEPGTTPSGTALPGLMTSIAPWGANNDQLAERMAILDLPQFQDNEGHAHARLWIYVHGEQEEVPTDLGFPGDIASPLHTHDTTGTIHIEAVDMSWAPSLGTFFDTWGLRLSSDCIGAYCSQGDDTLQVFVNGEPFEGDPRTISMHELDVVEEVAIVLTYGTDDELPETIPDSFTFGS